MHSVNPQTYSVHGTHWSDIKECDGCLEYAEEKVLVEDLGSTDATIGIEECPQQGEHLHKHKRCHYTILYNL